MNGNKNDARAYFDAMLGVALEKEDRIKKTENMYYTVWRTLRRQFQFRVSDRKSKLLKNQFRHFSFVTDEYEYSETFSVGHQKLIFLYYNGV